jgi:transcriptional regulator with XRE-family HTH domain
MARRETLIKPVRITLLRNIRKKLRQLRLQKGLTQEALAELSKLHPKYVTRWENNDLNPSISTIADAVNALGLSLEDFFAQIQPRKSV